MTERIQVHVPAKKFGPSLSQGYRSDLANPNSYTIMDPISLGGVRLTDLLVHGAAALSGPGDFVMFNAPYGIIRLYLTWPGYVGCEQLITYDMYCHKERPTRASIACDIARMFTKFMERCKPFRLHSSAARWRIGEGGLSAHNVLFNQLVNTYENVWQVDCDIIV